MMKPPSFLVVYYLEMEYISFNESILLLKQLYENEQVNSLVDSRSIQIKIAFRGGENYE